VSILFEARHIPASLYKCLWAFATNNVNLTKLESIPSFKGNFSFMFWLDFQGKLSDEPIQKALEELEFFTTEIRILGQY
jgi:prephenate dehydratase